MTLHLSSMGPPALALLSLVAVAPAQDWTHHAGSPTRAVVLPGIAPDLARVRWTASTDPLGSPINFAPQATPVAWGDFVYAVGRRTTGASPHRLLAFRRDTGQPIWAATIDPPSLDSRSSPAIAPALNLILVASGSTLRAFDLLTGAPRFTTTLTRPVVNASPLIVDDLGPARAFITEYDGFGTSGRLTCINLAPNSPINPFTPGQILWSVVIGPSSGNTPAYLPREAGGLGLVYVATAGSFSVTPGQVLAFPADATTTPLPTWTTDNTIPEGFFGGLCVAAPAAQGLDPTIFLASYSFFGELDSANLLRVNARTGAVQASIPSNRSASIPLPLPDHSIILASGIVGFGSVPSLTRYADPILRPSDPAILWDTARDTWTDLNADGLIDPGETIDFAGWTQQPIALLDQGQPRVILPTSTNATSAAGFSQSLRVIDPTRSPTAAGFVLSTTTRAGNPARIGPAVVVPTAQGLTLLGSIPPDADVDMSGRVTIEDLIAWERGVGSRDVDGDGAITPADRRLLLEHLRARERRDLRPSAGGTP